MKRILWSALLALPLCVQPAQAQVYISHTIQHNGMPPVAVQLNTPMLSFNLFGGGGRTQLGPWYQYWPYDAHFQQGAPMGILQGPYVMTLPPGYGQAPMIPSQYAQQPWSTPQYAQQPWSTPQYAQQSPTPPASIPPAPQQGQTQQTMFQPVGYNYPGQVPSYWYGR